MKLIRVILITATVFAVEGRRLITTTPAPRESESHVLGTADGKTFVADFLHRDWASARSFCESRGMKLATITSKAQSDFLKLAYDPFKFNGWYWIAARVNKKGEFSWVDTKENVKTFKTLVTSTWSNEDDDRNCLVYSSNNHATGYYFRRACQHGQFTLCQSDQPIESNAIETENTRKAEPELMEIGSYNGKTYFGDQVIRNWTDSYSFCKSKGLQLATIGKDDRQQTNFLKKACHKINYDGWFWVTENNLRGIGKLDTRSEEDIKLCPFLDARDKRLSRRPCFNRHFTLCESVESDGLTTNAVDLNGDEKYVEEVAETSMERVSQVDAIDRLFAGLSKTQKKELLDFLILMQLMDGILKRKNPPEEFDILSSGTVSVEEDDILSSPEISTDEDDI